jgi:hypothetical protein
VVPVEVELFKKVPSLACADAVEASIAPSKAYGQCPTQTGMPESSGRRWRPKALQYRSTRKILKEDDVVPILQSQLSKESSPMQHHSYLWVNGNKIVIICTEKVRRDCEDIVGREATLQREARVLQEEEGKGRMDGHNKQTHRNRP